MAKTQCDMSTGIIIGALIITTVVLCVTIVMIIIRRKKKTNKSSPMIVHTERFRAHPHRNRTREHFSFKSPIQDESTVIDEMPTVPFMPPAPMPPPPMPPPPPPPPAPAPAPEAPATVEVPKGWDSTDPFFNIMHLL